MVTLYWTRWQLPGRHVEWRLVDRTNSFVPAYASVSYDHMASFTARRPRWCGRIYDPRTFASAYWVLVGSTVRAKRIVEREICRRSNGLFGDDVEIRDKHAPD